MLELNKIYNYDCLEGLKQLDDNSVDLTVTSPPYDSLRTYADKNTGNECVWNFEVFKPIAQELYRVTKKGGVVVWVVGDACIDNGETGSSFRQALYFQELGFKIHDTMIYEKNSSSFPAKLASKRYSQIFEYMFIFSKGKIRGDIKLIADKRNKWAGWTNWGEHSQYDIEGNLINTSNIKPIAEFSLRNNIWRYPVSFNDRTGHPAVFPEKLAEDHILSWSNEGETVLDPFMGSGTTAKMAMLNHRNYIGFELNTGYWEKSIERVEKYEGKENDKVFEISTNDTTDLKDEPEEILQVNPVADKDDEKKHKLWDELTAELRDYFDTQSLGILKNLRVKLTFESKANDKRVQKVMQERGLQDIPLNNSTSADGILLKAAWDNAPAAKAKRTYETPSATVIKALSVEGEFVYPEGFWDKVRDFIHQELFDEELNAAIDRRIIEVSKKWGICQKEPVQLSLFPDELVAEEVANEPNQAEIEPIPVKRKRGRPKGSKNKPVIPYNNVTIKEIDH